MRTVLMIAACSLMACGDDGATDELELIAVGTPTVAKLVPGKVVHEICLVGDAGANVNIDDLSEGTVDRMAVRLEDTEIPAGCPERVIVGRTNGWAKIQWSTATGMATATVFQSSGPVISAPQEVSLAGQMFPGYAITIVTPAEIDENGATLEIQIAYRQAGSEETTPASHVPFDVATIPELEQTFPVGDMATTDRTGKVTLAFATPMDTTSVIVTAVGDDPQLVTKLVP